MPNSRFPTVLVTAEVDTLLQELTDDTIRHTTAPTELAPHTYSLLCQSRQRLYEYIQSLEDRCGLHGTGSRIVIRRFL